MTEKYNPLSYTTLSSDTTYHRPLQQLPERVTAENPATDVMTDFTKVAAIIMGPCAGLEQAEARMIASGVRMLLIVDQANRVLGILTATDLQGTRPVKYMQETGTKREDIYLRDIMTPQDKVEVLQMKDVQHAKVGDIIATLKNASRQHALVVENDPDGQQIVRGIISTKQISRQLGLDFEAKESSAILEEIEAAMA